ncbi:hypothetical protein BO226_10865 [Rhodococcus sp. 2G]|nr:hypothetical protein BO226_10865 [Rhodococcus sp. 2G]
MEQPDIEGRKIVHVHTLSQVVQWKPRRQHQTLGALRLSAVFPRRLTLEGGPFFGELALEFSHRGEHSDHHAPGGRRRVDAIRGRYKGDTPLREGAHDLEDVERVAAESVEFPHDDGVTVAHILEHGGEPRPVVAGTGLSSPEFC